MLGVALGDVYAIGFSDGHRNGYRFAKRQPISDADGLSSYDGLRLRDCQPHGDPDAQWLA